MSKLGKRLISAAKSAQAIAKGEADPKTIHVPAHLDLRGAGRLTLNHYHRARAPPDVGNSRASSSGVDRACACVSPRKKSLENRLLNLFGWGLYQLPWICTLTK